VLQVVGADDGRFSLLIDGYEALLARLKTSATCAKARLRKKGTTPKTNSSEPNRLLTRPINPRTKVADIQGSQQGLSVPTSSSKVVHTIFVRNSTNTHAKFIKKVKQ